MVKLDVDGERFLQASCSAKLLRESAQPGLTVVLSDFYDLDGAFDGLNLLRFRKHEPIAIQILDPVEAREMADKEQSEDQWMEETTDELFSQLGFT